MQKFGLAEELGQRMRSSEIRDEVRMSWWMIRTVKGKRGNVDRVNQGMMSEEFAVGAVHGEQEVE